MNPLKTYVFSALLIGALAPGLSMAEETTAKITVTGQGRVETVPDMATITLGVTQDAKAASDAMRATSEAMGQALDSLTALGVEERDIQTSNISLNPVWTGNYNDGDRRITGYLASNTVRVRVRDLDALGELMDAVIQDGANAFQGLSFGVADPQPLQDEARKNAVSEAMRKAQIMAEAAGLTLGSVRSMSEAGNTAPRPVMMEMAAARSSDAVPVAAGEVSLSATVTMVFELTD